ncbi:Fc.00g071590.m01.CDS01 [Cosmosporella sp. VM-42]
MSTLYEVPNKGGGMQHQGLGKDPETDYRFWSRIGIIARSAAYQFASRSPSHRHPSRHAEPSVMSEVQAEIAVGLALVRLWDVWREVEDGVVEAAWR